MTWSRFEDKLFEQALVVFPDELPNRWEMIASRMPGKSPAEVHQHYEDLLHDVAEIDSGRVEPPSYGEVGGTWSWGGHEPMRTSPSSGRALSGSKAKAEAERRKGTPWTDEEHRLFLVGLQRYGKGDWRSISRNVVVSRTPTQVASHAQKYFLRQLNPAKKDRKRPSIHDVAAAAAAADLEPSSPAHLDIWAGYLPHPSTGAH